MSRVDFYVLDLADERSRQTLACRLAEKAYRLENTVYIHARDRAEAQRLDEMLWTFRDGSFVPHAMKDSGDDDDATPVTIGTEGTSVDPGDLLINLCDDIPAFAADFPRIAEVVNADRQCRVASRRRFAEYREHGHSIQTHKL